MAPRWLEGAPTDRGVQGLLQTKLDFYTKVPILVATGLHANEVELVLMCGKYHDFST